jgi:hypothetical protein
MDIDQNDAGVLPDDSAPVGTPDGEIPQMDGFLSDEVNKISDVAEVEETSEDIEPIESIEEDDSTDEISDIKAEMESVIESNANDSQLVKKLRDLVKIKYDDFSSKEVLPETQKETVDLVKGLFEFDPELGQPTTRNFAKKLAEKDINIASQALADLSNVALDENGWTLGHQFLENLGLDPYKINELRQYSRGEIEAETYGIVPDNESVPKELQEAYKSLDSVTRSDVNLYLDSDNEMQKMAALRTLRNQQVVIDNDRFRQESVKTAESQFNTEVFTSTAQDLETTYGGVMEALKTNPAYTNVVISSNKDLDTVVKDSVIAQLNALGDPRSVLAKQAEATLNAHGVKVDTQKIQQLMNTIENTTRIAIAAEKKAVLDRRDYTPQIQDALKQKSDAVASLTALGNRYFSQVLKKLTGVDTNTPNPEGGIPSITSKGQPIETPSKNGAKTMAELDAEILGIAQSISAGARN